MLAKVTSAAAIAADGVLVEIECDISNGLPSLVVVGLGNQAVNEARDRVRSAIRNSQLMLPPKRITLNLAPADLPKDGTAFDVGIAVAVLLASGQIESADGCLFIGELALEGSLRPVRGVLAYAQLAAQHGFKNIFVPAENKTESALIEGVTTYGANNLLEIYGHLAGLQPLTPVSRPRLSGKPYQGSTIPDLATIRGQSQAKRVIEIAAAGGHNVLLSGPPGSGKTMLSRALVGLLPPPNLPEMIEISKIHSLAGRAGGTVVTERPFRNPHHTSSDIALIGGGRIPRPGEISLSHHGVLFLDEIPEFRREVLEVLRQPLEDGTVTVARASGSTTFPAEFILIAAQNPCPCGYAGDSVKECSCSQAVIARYNQKISGPLLDRIDLATTVTRVNLSDLQGGNEPSTAAVAKRVAKARSFQLKGRLNARIDNKTLQQICRLTPDATLVLGNAMQNLSLSARSYMRTLKVARTIANLEGRSTIKAAHIQEALSYRPRA